MTPQQLFATAIRLFVIYLLLSASAFLVMSGALLDPLDSPAVLIFAFYVLASIGLWKFPMTLAHSILPKTMYDNRLDFQAYPLARVGVALIGLWFVAQAVNSVVPLILMIFGNGINSSLSILDQLSQENIYRLTIPFVTGLTGLLIMFNARKIALMCCDSPKPANTISEDKQASITETHHTQNNQADNPNP
jgi:hypothetical protein